MLTGRMSISNTMHTVVAIRLQATDAFIFTASRLIMLHEQLPLCSVYLPQWSAIRFEVFWLLKSATTVLCTPSSLSRAYPKGL